jgi:hypothetical protein
MKVQVNSIFEYKITVCLDESLSQEYLCVYVTQFPSTINIDFARLLSETCKRHASC